jgi:uncharacterized damage-inducible protein DinB
MVQITDPNLAVAMMRHNTWASLRLLDSCAALDEAHLDATAPGTMGSIREILTHLAGAEERYAARFTGHFPPVNLERSGFPGLAVLREKLQTAGAALAEAAATHPADEVLIIERNGETQKLQVGIVLTQAVNHGTDHRSQIATILTQAGVEPPEMDAWAYREADER